MVSGSPRTNNSLNASTSTPSHEDEAVGDEKTSRQCFSITPLSPHTPVMSAAGVGAAELDRVGKGVLDRVLVRDDAPRRP
jgi:hypothetical protein